MPGTANNDRLSKLLLGAGKIYGKVAVPASNARMTLHTDLTPESVANPDAIHLGTTDAGATFSATSEFPEYFVDEYAEAVAIGRGQTSVSLEGAFTSVADIELLELLSAGVGTRATGSGYDQLQLGTKALVYHSIAIIAPLQSNPALVVVAQIYRAMNTTGFSAAFGRTVRGSTPFNFRGIAVPGRADNDKVGTYWTTVAV